MFGVRIIVLSGGRVMFNKIKKAEGGNMKKLEKKVLAEGEVTGHAHTVDVDVFEREDGLRQFEGATKVTHQEHKEIQLPEKIWLTDKVVEYDEFEQQARRVRD